MAWEDAEQQPATSEGDGKSEPSSSSGPDLWAAGSHVDGRNRRKHHHLGGLMMDHEAVGSSALEVPGAQLDLVLCDHPQGASPFILLYSRLERS